LPTGLPYKSNKPGISDYNNPMIMGTQYGTYGSVSVIVEKLPSNRIAKFMVGVREAGSKKILGYAFVHPAPERTYVYFNAKPGTNVPTLKTFYEVVVGYHRSPAICLTRFITAPTVFPCFLPLYSFLPKKAALLPSIRKPALPPKARQSRKPSAICRKPRNFISRNFLWKALVSPS